MISAIMLVSYRVFSPLIESVDDQEVKDLMKTLKEEGKKKRANQKMYRGAQTILPKSSPYSGLLKYLN